jgi:hypothetical protein
MTLRYGDPLRTNQVAQINSTGSSGALLKIWATAAPANCQTADVAIGNLLCTINLPTPFLSPGAAGVTQLAGVWSGTGAAAAGGGTNAGHFRIYTSAGTIPCVMQGDVTTDLVLNNINIASGQTVTVNTFTITAGNQ